MLDFPGRSICYLTGSSVPSDAANSVHIVHMCQALTDLGNTVTLVAPTLKLPFKNKMGVLCLKYGVKGDYKLRQVWIAGVSGGRWLYEWQLNRIIQRASPDIIYGRNLTDCLFTAQRGHTTVLEVHTPVWMKGEESKRIFEALIVEPTFQALVVISKALSEVYVNRYPDLKNLIIIAHDAAPDWPQIKKPEKINSKLRVVYVGGLYPGKGIEILAKLSPRCPWAEFIVVGGSEQEIKHWQSRFPKVPENLVFLGKQPHASVYEYLVSADVLVAPFQHHVQGYGDASDLAPWMSPLKIFEYMAACRPMVVSDLPVIREVLEHERNALLVDPEDVDSWVHAIERMRDNPDFAEAMALRGYSEYRKRYTWHARAERILTTLKSIN